MTTPAVHRGGGDRHARPVDRDEAHRRLRAKGGRLTEAKRRMVEVFLATESGLTAEQVGAQLPDVDQATVYRTLVQFEQAGIVEHVHLGHGAATYRRAGTGGVPVVCEVCGRVIEIAPADLDSLVATVRRRHKMVIDAGHFALTGRCTTCQPPA